MNRKIKHLSEYVALRIFQGIVTLLPYRIALAFGASIGWVAYSLVRWRVNTAKERIRDVFGEKLSQRAINRIAFLSMRYMIFNLVDVLRVKFWTKERFNKHSNFEIVANRLKEHISDNKGAIIALPHMGSWELGGIASKVYGAPLFFIVGVQRNAYFNDFMKDLRSGAGDDAIPREDRMMLRKVIKNLRAGKVLGMTNDLRSKTKGISVQFLGKEANIVGGMALFARQAKVPVLPMICYRESWTQHRCKLCDPIEPDLTLDKEEDWQRITQKTLSMYEEEIRKRPEQYFWYNKRWVLEPFIEATDEPSIGP